jgi:diphthamide biosynthesis methyltransferase
MEPVSWGCLYQCNFYSFLNTASVITAHDAFSLLHSYILGPVVTIPSQPGQVPQANLTQYF